MIARIVKGSRVVFDIALRDSNGNPISLSDYDTAELRFRSCEGVVTEHALDITVAPDSGIINVDLPPAVTALADDGWKDADLVLDEDETTQEILPLYDAFEIISPAVTIDP